MRFVLDRLRALNHGPIKRLLARNMCLAAGEDYELWGCVLEASDYETCFDYIVGSFWGASWRDVKIRPRRELVEVCLDRLDFMDLSQTVWGIRALGSMELLADLDWESASLVIDRWRSMAAFVITTGYSNETTDYVRSRIEATGVDWERGRAVLCEQLDENLDGVCETLSALARGEAW